MHFVAEQYDCMYVATFENIIYFCESNLHEFQQEILHVTF